MLTSARIEESVRELAKQNPPLRCRRCQEPHYVVRPSGECGPGSVKVWGCESCGKVQVIGGRS